MSALESVRVRLEFEDRRILSKAQRKAGLKRSWMVLKPQHRTVSDLASHLLHAFGLQESCPHGLILSMDGFVLPPFESTSVFKDKDVVWVKRKEESSIGTTRLRADKNSRNALEIVDKQPVNGNLLLLANEEFIKETGGYESESEDAEDEDEDEDEPSADTNNNVENAAYKDVDSKKRKASKKLKSPKRKKSRHANAEESPGACVGAENEEPAAKKGNLQVNKFLLKDGQLEKDKSYIKGKKDMASTSRKDREIFRNDEPAAKKKAKKSSAACGDAGNEEPVTKMESPQGDKVLLKDNQLEKVKSSHIKGKNNIASTSKNDKEVSALSLSSADVKGKGSVDASPTPSEAKKLPSRSARRKKLKRQWLREMRKIGNTEEGQRRQSSGGDDWRKKFLGDSVLTFGSQDDNKKSEERQQHPQSHVVAAVTGNQQPHHDNSSKDVTVPIEIRPGHIRFEPLDDDADQPTQKSTVPVTTFQWNGVTDKKKGQKWGREKGATKWTENGYQKTKWTDNSYQKTKWTDNNKQKTTWTGSNYQNAAWTDNSGQNAAWNGSQNLNQEPSQEASQEKEAHQSDSMDFSKLSPYGPVPQEGDIVAYRVIELSSSWTPEVSPFRIGKISSCKQGSKKITLLPVPEHPFDLEKVDKALYGEDGSLEVDFTSLVDVRTFDSDKSGSAQAVAGQRNETTAGDSDAVRAQGNNKDEVNPAPAKENGGANAWEEIAQALSAKKSELSQEDRWKRKENPATGPPSSSYRGMRRSALGPIMALLRAQNAMV